MARHFVSASNQRLEVSPPVINAVPLTMAAWIRSTNGSAFQRPLAIGGSVNNNYFEFRLRGDTGGSLEFVSLWGATGAIIAGGGSYTAGVPFHMCAVVRGNADRELFKNGTSVAVNTTACDPPNPFNMTIGILHAAGGWFNGLDGEMAEVGFWRVALTPKEVQQLAAGAPCDAVRNSDLMSYMPLDQDIFDRRRNIWTDSGGSTAVSTFVPLRRIRRDYDAQAVAAAPGAVRVLPVVVRQAVQRAANW